MKKVFAEIGLGNDTFLSTEFEEGDSEYRVPKFVIPKKYKNVISASGYLRKYLFYLRTMDLRQREKIEIN